MVDILELALSISQNQKLALVNAELALKITPVI